MTTACWDYAPISILDSIFNRLSDKDIPGVRIVCSSWRKAMALTRNKLGIYLPPADGSFSATALQTSASAASCSPLASLCGSVTDLTVLRRSRAPLEGLDARLIDLPSLTALRLTPVIHDAELKGLCALPRLTSVDFSGGRLSNRLTNSGIENLCGLTSLTSLDISGCRTVTDDGVVALHSIVALTSMNLSRTSVTGSCFVSPADGPQGGCPFPNLSKLDLSACRQLHPSQLLPSLRGRTRLTHIKLGREFRAPALDSDFITRQGPYDWAAAANLSNQLRLSEIQCLIASLPLLLELDLSGWQIASEGREERGPPSWIPELLSSSSSLANLCLSHATVFNGPPGEGLIRNSYHRGQTTSPLMHLNLSRFSDFRDSDGPALHSVSGTLTHLNLSYSNKLSDRGLSAVASLSALRSLILNGCEKITYRGLEALRGLSELRVLGLGSCPRMTDAGIETSAALLSLERLNCSCCNNITDHGLLALHCHGAAPRLMTLRLAACDNITEEAIRQLTAARPGIRVK